jgi:hypothetical protein
VPAGTENDETAEARSKRSTPAERPRRRRQVRAEQQAPTMPRATGTERPHHYAGALRSTPDRLRARAEQGHAHTTKRSRGIAVAVAVAILLGAGLWLLRC